MKSDAHKNIKESKHLLKQSQRAPQKQEKDQKLAVFFQQNSSDNDDRSP